MLIDTHHHISLIKNKTFPFLSIQNAYKWSAKLLRELLLLVNMFQRMRKKNSLVLSLLLIRLARTGIIIIIC